MAQVSGETAKRIAQEFYDHPLPETSATSLATALGALLNEVELLEKLGLDGVEPPFSYETLLAEAVRTQKGGQ